MKTTKNLGEASGRKTMLLVAMAAMMLVFGLVLAACDNGNGGGGDPDVKKSFILKGEVKGVKVGGDVKPQKVVVYGNPKFEGKPLGEGVFGGGGSKSVLFTARSIGDVSRNIGTVTDYTNDTSWEIPLTNIDPNDSPELYFAVTGVVEDMGEDRPFIYPLNDFELPVTGINDGEDFDINTRPGTNPFNDGIELEIIGIEGQVKITGVTTADRAKFGTGKVWLMVYYGGVEISGSQLLVPPRLPEDTEGPEHSVDFLTCIPARAGTLTFDLAFGDDAGKTRANVSGISSHNLTAEELATAYSGPATAAPRVKDIDLGTGDITGKTIP
ncbi:hypothetical protein AGMMS49940_19200 [Spirochaetia bacterium]|nr:hypothetical protein AGMMS49940_19200 [Spirochaetia bacterium]